MASIERNLMEAVRAVLIADGTLTALVPATQIRPKDSPYPAVYPAISLSAPGSRAGGFAGTWDGLFWVRIYHQGANPYGSLYAIQDAVRVLLDSETAFSDISDSDVGVDLFREVTASEVIVEDEAPVRETYSINMPYRVLAKDKT